MVERIELELSQNQFQVELGATVSAAATVRYTGELMGQYRLTVEGLDPAWWEITPGTVALFPGDGATVALTFRPPLEANAGSLQLQLRATAVGDPSRSASADIRLETISRGGVPSKEVSPASEPPRAAEAPRAPEPPRTVEPPRAVEPPPAARIPDTPPAVKQDRGGGVEASLSQSQFKLQVGATGKATATIRNRGTVVDQYSLAVENLDPTWWEIAPQAVSLFPESEATVTVTLHPPADALAGAHPFQVRAVSSDDPSRTAAVDATLEVMPAGALLLALDPTIATGRSGRYSARLTNRANAEAQVAMAGRDREEALEYRFEPPALLVPAFGETSTSLVVRPRGRRLWGQPLSYPFTIQAMPEGAEEPAAEATGELQHRPLIRPIPLPAGRWRWLLALIPLLALAFFIRSLLQAGPEPPPTPTATVVAAAKPTAPAKPTEAGAGSAQVAGPKILSFELVRAQPGFSLAWKVADAEKVELNGTAVDPEGKQPIREPKDQGYELKASNKGGTVIKRINMLVFPPPVVKSLRAEPPEIYQGESSTLRWEVDGADRAKLDGKEARLPRGWLEVRPESSREYLLTAENQVGWVVQRVPIKVINAPSPESKLRTYSYDFKESADDWELGTGVWSRVPWEGGYALRGAGHGFVRLTAYSGEVSSLSFRYYLDSPDSSLHVNLLESLEDVHSRYLLSLGPEGAAIRRQQGQDFRDLAVRRGTPALRRLIEGRVYVGDGSIDVFMNGSPFLGADDPDPLRRGYVSFESLDRTVVYLNKVEVQIGQQPTQHPRAPRPTR